VFVITDVYIKMTLPLGNLVSRRVLHFRRLPTIDQSILSQRDFALTCWQGVLYDHILRLQKPSHVCIFIEDYTSTEL